MKNIKLPNNITTLIDDWNYDYLNQFVWYISKRKDTYYVARHIYVGGKRKHIYMHREIMNVPEGVKVDHRNRNGLDNQEHNLRECTNSQNGANRKSSGRSQYLGVCIWHSKDKYKYIKASINIEGTHIHLGTFPTEELAARAYDEAAIKYFGEFANLNFK